MSLPRVSIVVPVYNGANYMRAALDSALAQDYPDFEVVVVNDGSRDDGATDAIARSYGDRIRYVAKENGGVATALNAGIAAMTGEIFCWLSHDDIHLPHKTRRQAEEWVRLGRPAREVLIADYRLIGPDGAALGENRLDHALLEAKPLYALLRGSIHGCSVFLPRGLFDEVGGFDPALPTTQDYDLWFRMIQAGARFRHMPEVLIESRQHDEQGSRQADHVLEATALWRRMVRDTPHAVKLAMEGTALRFAERTAAFLAHNGLHDTALALHADAERALLDTLVTAVIPVFNRIGLAVAAVESAAAQLHPRVEIVVVDDGSTEDTQPLERAVARHAGRARLIRQANAGAAAARNRGWAEAKGEYVAFLDADDLWLPNKVTAQLRIMEEQGAAFSHTSYQLLTSDPARMRRMPAGRYNDFPAIISGCGIATPTVMVRTSLREEGLRFPGGLAVSEDITLWLRIASRHGVVGIDHALTVVRAGDSATAHDFHAARVGARVQLAACLEDERLSIHGDQVAALRQFVLNLEHGTGEGN